MTLKMYLLVNNETKQFHVWYSNNSGQAWLDLKDITPGYFTVDRDRVYAKLDEIVPCHKPGTLSVFETEIEVPAE